MCIRDRHWTKWKTEKYATRVHSELRKAGEEYTRPGDLFEKGDRYEMAPPPKSQATILMMKSEDARVRNTGIERNGFYYNDQMCIRDRLIPSPTRRQVVIMIKTPR